jgi:hypothetical protein
MYWNFAREQGSPTAPAKLDFDKREVAHSLRPESPIEKRSAVQCRRFEAVHTFDAIAGYSKTGWSLSLYELELVSLAKWILVITDKTTNLLFAPLAPVDLVAKPPKNNKIRVKTAGRTSSTESTSCCALRTVLINLPDRQFHPYSERTL